MKKIELQVWTYCSETAFKCYSNPGHKVPTVCDTWLGFAKYNDQYSKNKCTWVKEHHEVILAVNQ